MRQLAPTIRMDPVDLSLVGRKVFVVIIINY